MLKQARAHLRRLAAPLEPLEAIAGVQEPFDHSGNQKAAALGPSGQRPADAEDALRQGVAILGDAFSRHVAALSRHLLPSSQRLAAEAMRHDLAWEPHQVMYSALPAGSGSGSGSEFGSGIGAIGCARREGEARARAIRQIP